MKTYQCVTLVRIKGKVHRNTIALSDKDAAPLLKAGAIALLPEPKGKEPDK